MPETGAMVPRRRPSSRLFKVVAGIVVFLLVLIVSYAVWTVYENTLTPAALGTAPDLGWTGASGEVWLDPATRQLARLRLTFQQPDGSTGNDGTLTVDFRDYDAPITISAPGS